MKKLNAEYIRSVSRKFNYSEINSKAAELSFYLSKPLFSISHYTIYYLLYCQTKTSPMLKVFSSIRQPQRTASSAKSSPPPGELSPIRFAFPSAPNILSISSTKGVLAGISSRYGRQISVNSFVLRLILIYSKKG